MGDFESPNKQPTKSRATAGPSEDDRFGPGPVAKHLEAKVLKADIVNGGTLVTLSKGRLQGVRQSLEGYIKGLYANLIVQDVERDTCRAFVDVTFDELADFRDAVINPHAMPRAPARPDPGTTRVIAVAVRGERTKITIARGVAHGVVIGTRGHLMSPDGIQGDAFTIFSATSRQADAYVTNTVDYVNAHPNVKLELSARATAPVQRRTDAPSKTNDVHATAQAGVAGASSPLPFVDTIQRSFGKHDISNIQSHVGGPATAASEALGARAYATGDKVAFASTPDLHTAAHEAAHTIQQRHGAVGFQGLGAADDEHERHADAVADAVVAGESAEPLLDQIVGGSATAAVQRKSVKQRNTEHFNRQLEAANDSRYAWDAVAAAADIIRNRRERATERTGPYAEALRSLYAALLGKRDGRVVPARERLALFKSGIQTLDKAIVAYASGPGDQADWVEEHLRVPILRERANLEYIVADERVKTSIAVDGTHVIDAKYDDDPESQLPAIRAALPGVLDTLYNVNEWSQRLSHLGIENAVKQMLQGAVPKQFGKMSSLAQLHSVLESVAAILAVTDDRELLAEARGRWHWVSSRVEFVKTVVQLVGSTAAVASGIISHVAKLSGRSDLSLVLSGAAKHMSMKLSEAITWLEIVSGAITIVDPTASRQEKIDAAVAVTTNMTWLVYENRAKAAELGVGTALPTGVAAGAFALHMGYLELKYALELYWGASLGLVTGLMRPALERLHRDGLAIARASEALLKAQVLARAEKDPSERAALGRVVSVSAQRLGTEIDALIASTLPPTLEAGMAHHPGGYPILVEALAPIKRHKGARTPEAVAVAAKTALERINWIMSHAAEIFFAQTRREGIKAVEKYRKQNDEKREKKRQEDMKGAV